MNAGTKDRFLGTLLGMAAGGSLGAPVRGKTAAEIRKIGGKALDEALSAGPAGNEPGDELGLAFLWLVSLSRTGRIDLDDVAARYVAWHDAGPRQLSALPRAAIAELARGVPPGDSGRIAWESLGGEGDDNGGLLAAVPVGLLHAAELRGVADDAAAASRVTHAGPRCVAANRALAMAVALAVRGLDDEVVERASLVASPSPALREVIERSIDADPKKLVLDGPDRHTCTRATEAAFAAYVQAANFERGLKAVVERGGDTAVNGALAGALLGARFGTRAVPARWLPGIAGREAILAAGEALWERCFGEREAARQLPGS
jgi:ADP-ribosyl-[dinitrogen reductase] hydrolase